MYCRLRAEKTQTTRGFKNFFHMRLIYLRPFLHGCNTIRYHYRYPPDTERLHRSSARKFSTKRNTTQVPVAHLPGLYVALCFTRQNILTPVEFVAEVQKTEPQ